MNWMNWQDDDDYAPVATMSEACLEYASNAGSERTECAWILSPWDTWHRNPCYSGPPVPHPECDDEYYEDVDEEVVR